MNYRQAELNSISIVRGWRWNLYSYNTADHVASFWQSAHILQCRVLLGRLLSCTVAETFFLQTRRSSVVLGFVFAG
jgi:hypothetical protein